MESNHTHTHTPVSPHLAEVGDRLVVLALAVEDDAKGTRGLAKRHRLISLLSENAVGLQVSNRRLEVCRVGGCVGGEGG